jgi:tetratricopeptide (TPR) repeat protein
LEAALRIWDQLLREPLDRQNPLHNSFIKKCDIAIGYVLAGRGSFAEVPQRFEKIRDRVTKRERQLECDFLFDLARVAYLLSTAEKHGWAEQSVTVTAAVREAAGILKKLLLRPALLTNTRCQLAQIGFDVIGYLRRAGATEEALELCEVINRALQALVQKAPTECYLLEALSSSCIQIAKTRWDLKRPEEALAEFRSALALQRQAFALAPEDPGCRWELNACYRHLGRRLCELGRLDEAEACFKERLALWPGDVDWQAKVLGELRHWAAQVGEDVSRLSPAQQQERQRYLDLCFRLEQKGVKDSVSVTGKTP